MKVEILDCVVVSGMGILFPGAVVEVSEKDADRLVAENSARVFVDTTKNHNRAITREELITRVRHNAKP